MDIDGYSSTQAGWPGMSRCTVDTSIRSVTCMWIGSSSDAVGVGFEPTEGVNPHSLSRRARSAASVPHQGGAIIRRGRAVCP